MREIKFRAWDTIHHVFIPNDVYAVVTTDFNAFGVMLKDWSNYREGEYFYSDSQVLLQYTGLNDDNGSNIYEGDIISDIEGNRYEVEWNDDTCKYQFNDGSDINDGDRYSTYKIVVGNIYEHPNLRP